MALPEAFVPPLPPVQARVSAVITRLGPWKTTARGKVSADVATRVGAWGLEGSSDFQSYFKWEAKGYTLDEGMDRAVLAQTSAHLEAVRSAGLTLRQPLEPLVAGIFDENLFLEAPDFHAENICIGDEFAVWRSGMEQPVRFRVVSPRCPCAFLDSKHGKTFNLKGVRAHCASTGHAGFFLRVVKVGDVREGDVFHLAARPNPSWSLARVSRLLYGHPTSVMHYMARAMAAQRDRSTPGVQREEWMGTEEELRELAAVPELANYEYKEYLVRMLNLPGIGKYRRLRSSSHFALSCGSALAVFGSIGMLLALGVTMSAARKGK